MTPRITPTVRKLVAVGATAAAMLAPAVPAAFAQAPYDPSYHTVDTTTPLSGLEAYNEGVMGIPRLEIPRGGVGFTTTHDMGDFDPKKLVDTFPVILVGADAQHQGDYTMRKIGQLKLSNQHLVASSETHKTAYDWEQQYAYMGKDHMFARILVIFRGHYVDTINPIVPTTPTQPPAAQPPANTTTPPAPPAKPAAPSQFTGTLNGKTVELTQIGDTYTGRLTETGKPTPDAPDTLTVTGDDTAHTTVTLTRQGTPAVNTETRTDGSAHSTWTATYTATQGEYANKITLTVDGSGDTQPTGSWTANGAKLTVDNTAGTVTGTVTLKDTDTAPTQYTVTTPTGETVNLTVGKPVLTRDTNNGLTVKWSADAAGTDKNGVKITVHLNGSKHFTEEQLAWKATIGDTQTPLTITNGQLSYPQGTPVRTLPDTLTVTNSQGNTVTLTKQGKPTLTMNSGATLGVAALTGSQTYHADATASTPAITLTIPMATDIGEALTVDKTGFEKKGDKFEATAAAVKLNDKNLPETSKVTLSDKSEATVKWDPSTTTTVRDGATYVTLNGTATGEITVADPATGQSVKQQYVIHMVANRAQDKAVKAINITMTDADGKTFKEQVKGFNEKHEATLVYDQPAVSSAYNLAVDAGVDAQVSPVTVKLTEQADRILKVSVNGVEYTVNVLFRTPELAPDSPAKLTGIYVNRSGKHEKGELIAGFNPNKLEYSIALKDNDPSPYLLPEAGDNVDIQAQDVEQTAQGAVQEWKVTDKKTGASRMYIVRVLRKIDTLVSEFKPKTPEPQKSTVKPDSATDTRLVSHGYVLNGKYVKVEGNEYTIPEGGVFSYEAKTGQTVALSQTHNLMTYTYTLSVLPENQFAAVKQYQFKVTYLTKATHEAVLQGLIVNGREINGFNPSKLGYEVEVDNLDQWTLAPKYDKRTGMSVRTVKKGDTATITVTSGDGQVKAAYMVKAVLHKDLLGNTVKNAKGTVGVGGSTQKLAQTGSNVLLLAIGTVGAALLGVGAFVVSKFGRRSVKSEGLR